MFVVQSMTRDLQLQFVCVCLIDEKDPDLDGELENNYFPSWLFILFQ